MENSFKRFLSLALAILMVFSNIPVSAFASEVAGCGHTQLNVTTTKEATCTEAGEMTFTCAVEGCGTSWTQEIAPSHHYVGGVCACGEVDPSYIAPMNDEEDIPESSETEAPETTSHQHSYESVVTAPTCTENGYTTHTCACEESYVDSYVDALGHSYAEGVCSVCGAEEPAHEHSYEAVVTPPSCKAGFTTYTCACGDTYTADEVAATTHTLGEDGKCIGCGEKPMTSVAPKTVGLTGSGTAEDPYKIRSAADLVLFRDSVNAGADTYSNPNVYVALTDDIDLTGQNWVGIGSINQEHGFMGNFDGNGFKIMNLTITNPALDEDGYAYAGLFSITEGTDKDNQNVIKNLIIENVTITTTGHIVSAAIAYPYYTKVENVTVCGDIKIEGGDYTSGVLAYTRRCVDASNLSVSGNEGSFITGRNTVGGVISDIQTNGGLIANYSDFSASGVTITGQKAVGGISGIIAGQTLDGCKVENVVLHGNGQVGKVSGSLGDVSTITDAVIENVTGATASVGADYDTGAAIQAKVDDTYYATLSAAAGAVKSGDTLTLLQDTTETIKLPEGVRLDKNGHTADGVTETVYAAKIGDQGYNSLQAAVNAVKNNETITLMADIAENVTLTEQTGLYYTIDGNGNKMNGTITITPLSDTNDNRRITIKNINFVDTADANVDFISSVNTNHYPRITVEGCSFTGSGNDGDVAIRLKSSHSVVISGCTGTGLHSFLQNTSGWNMTIENVTVTDSKGGLALGTVQGVTVKGSKIDVAGYGIRMDAQYNNDAVIESNTVKAFIPVVVRKAEVDSTLTFNGENKFTATNTDGLWCAIGTNEYEENGTMPTAPTGKVNLTLTDTGLSKDGAYGYYVPPRTGTITIGYTSTTGVWGEASNANAEESYVVELYVGNKKIATSTLGEQYITGEQKNITWSIPFAGQNNADWVTVWEEGYPNKNEQPTAVKLVIDGKTVSENVVQMNGPDSLNPVEWDKLEALQPDLAEFNGTAYKTVAAALEAAKAANVSDVTITLLGAPTQAEAIALDDSFNLYTQNVFNSVTFKQADASKVYHIAGIYTGSRTNGGSFVFDGVNIVVTDQYIFEGNVVLKNNSNIKSVAEANCFIYNGTTTIEPGSKLNGVIEDFRGGDMIVDGGKTDGSYNDEPDFQDAIMVVNWSGDTLVLQNGAYVKINSANEVGRLTVNNGAAVKLTASKLDACQYITLNAGSKLLIDGKSQITTPQITGTGTIEIDATDMAAGEFTAINADLSGFTGTVAVTGNNLLEAEIEEGKIILVAKPVAKVGNTEYSSIDEAIKDWTNGTTLTLVADVTLSDVIKLKSTEHHTLNLGTYTMTAASGKNAIEIVAYGTGSSERGALTISADATNPGGINAGKKSVVYYKYTTENTTGEDRPIIYITGGVFTGNTSSLGTAGIYTEGSAARKCATLNISGGTFNCSINGSNKSKLIISGGIFNYSVGSQGDSTALRLISGGTFKSFGFMTNDNKSGSYNKFAIGTEMLKYNVGVYVDDNGYLVVGGPVINEPGTTFEASSANYGGWSSHLMQSSAANNGLYYTAVEEALADNNKTTGSVTVYVKELDMTGISYKGTIVVPAESVLTITNAPANLKVTNEAGDALTPNANGTYVTIAPKGDNFNGYTGPDGYWGEVRGNAYKSFVIKVLDANGNVMGATSLKNIDGIIDGDVNVTWNLKLDAAANTDEYWTMSWTTAPSVDNMPAKVELWVDDVKVSGGNVVLNGPDDLNKIVAAVANADGKILGYYTTLSAAMGAASATDKILVLQNVTESMGSLKGNIITNNPNGVTIKNTIANAWIYCGENFTIGEGVTYDATGAASGLFMYAKNAVINGTVVTDTYYQRYADTKLTINEPGSMTVKTETFILRYTDGDGEAGIYIVGDNNDETVGLNASVIYFYQGMINAKDADIKVGTYWQTNETDNQGSANLVLDNSNMTVTVNEHNMKATGTSTVTLTNGSNVVVAGGYQGAAVAMDETSTFTKNGKSVLVAKAGGKAYATLAAAIADVADGGIITLLSNVTFDKNTRVLNSGSYYDGLYYIGDKSFTIDLNKFTIGNDSTVNDYLLNFKNDGTKANTITIKNGTLEAASSAYCAISTSTSNTQKITINVENINIVGNNSNGAVLKIRGGTELNVKAGTIITGKNSYVGIEAAGTGTVVNINEGAKIYQQGTGSYVGSLVGVSGNATANVYGGSGTSAQGCFIAMTSGGTINVEGGEWTANNDGTVSNDNKGVLIAQSEKGAKSVVNVTGGTFKGGYNCYGVAVGDAQLNISGGIFNADPSSYVAEGYEAVKKDDAFVVREIPTVAKIGDKSYTSLQAAVNAAEDGETITLVWAEDNDPISMNASVFGKSVTITGTATVDWSKGNLFIGRGGEGNGTVIFDNANLTSASNNATYGIHVSGREKNTTDKYDGTLVIKNSTIELDYLISKNIITLNKSTLTVKNGFSIGGRLADETESGVDATATLNLTDGSKLIVNNHNGMGLGAEGNKVGVGVMNIDKTSTFETTQSFLVTAKGTMNLAGTAKIAGTLTNNGSIVLTETAATLTATECANVTTNVADYKVIYADGAYKLNKKVYVAQIGEDKFESLEEAFAAAQTGETITLLADVAPVLKSQSAITKASIIDLGGKTLTLTEDDLYFGTTTFKNGTIVVDPSVKPSTAVFWMFANQTLTFDNVKIVATGVTGTYLIGLDGDNSDLNLLNGSEILVENTTALDLDIICVNASTGNDIVIDNSKVNVTNLDGRVLFRGNYTIKGDSELNLDGITKAGIRIEAGQTLSIEDNAKVTITGEPRDGGIHLAAPTASYTKANTATVNATVVKEPFKVSTKAELNAALNAAQEGDTIILTADIDYGTDQLAITKAITLDLGGKTLTTRNAYGGMSIKGNPTVKNGTIVHASNTAAIKVWNATAFEDLVIDVQGKGDANKVIGGIVLQSGSTTRVGSIKNVTIKGAALTNGIETYNCGDASENVIGSMENVTINAVGTGMLISAPCGTATNCSITGGTNGIEIWIKGNYSASLGLVNSKVEGGVYAHDEHNTNPDIVNNGTLSLTVDEATTGVTTETVSLTINHAKEEQVKGEVLETIIDNAKAKVNGTYYATLAEAMKAAKDGDTVTILAGEYNQSLNVNKAITVVGETDDKGNNLVKLNGGISITADGATVKNLTASNPATTGYNCTLTINAKDVLVEGCEITDANAMRYSETTGNVTLKDCVLTATDTWAIHFNGKAGGNVTVDGCEVNGWVAFAAALEKVTLKDSTFKMGNYAGGRTYNDDVVIDGCTFETGYKFDLPDSGANVVVTNSKMSDGSSIVNVFNSDDACGKNDIVIDGDAVHYVAKIGTVYYESLEEALAAVADWTTIKLVDNATLDYNAREAYGRASTTDIIIDGQGFTLTLNQKDSDWSSIGMANAKGKLTLKNMTIEKTGYGDTTGAWNTHAINFTTPVEMNKVTVNNAIAVGADAVLTNVTINEANGFYGLWIEANGQTVTVDGGSINATNGGRGIKIADEYVDDPASVTLSVTGTKFNTAKKAAVLVSSTAGAKITASDVNIENVAADKVNFAWVDEDWAADYSKVTVNGAPAAQEGIENFAAAIVGEKGAVIGYFKSITEAVNDCTEAGNYTIKMLADYAEDVTILQKEGVNIVIDGDGKTFSGTMNIHGGSNYGSDKLTIQNVQFETNEKDHDFIWSDSQEAPARYAHNVTVKDCDFTATGAGKNTAVGLRFRQAKNIDVINCSASGMHSLMQVNSSSEIVVDNASIVNCKNGVSFSQSDDVTVKNSYIKTNGATGYGIRGEGYTGYTLNVDSCDVIAYIPVLVRKTTGEGFTLNVTGDNSMKATNKFVTGGAWAVICANDASDEAPKAPTGTYELNVADKGLDLMNIYPQTLKGSGTESDPYQIGTAEELTLFRDSVNAGDTKYNAPGVYVALTADIDMAGATWERGIGDGINATFDGIFDGNNKTIKNLNMAPKADSDKYFCGGLFGYTFGAAVIKNVVLENITVTAEGEGHNVGALVGFANNNGGKLTVSNITVKNVTIDAPDAYGVGAIVGYSYRAMGTIENCTVDGATITGYSFVGGITGYSYSNAEIKNCSVNNAKITATSMGAGGIAGLALDGNNIHDNTVANTTVSATTNWGYVVGELGSDSVVVKDNTAAEPQVGGSYSTGEAVQAKIGDTYYTTLAKALTAAKDGDTINLIWSEGNAPISMKGYVSGKTVTITGEAQVDWEKGYLFVGRTNDGTAAADATLIFKDAKLTTTQGGDHGIHVSGAEKGAAEKANGTVQFVNSTVNLSYLINKGTMTLDNSTLTVKSGFSIGGRPASETESGKDATATLNLTNSSKVVVNNHNGMGLGYEAIGVMNIEKGSTFETTQSFLVTAKGTMNIAGTAKIEGTLTNNGSIVLTDAEAKLTASECGNVTSNVKNFKAVYENGVYVLTPDSRATIVGGLKTVVDNTRDSVSTTLKNAYANEALYVELWSGNTKLSTTTWAKTFPVAHSELTVSIVLKGSSSSWNTEWHEDLTVANLPDTIKVYADGQLVDTFTKEGNAFQYDKDLQKYLALENVYKAAKIGDTYFVTVQDAVNAAKNGETVTLLADSAEDITVKQVEGVNITIDGNGKTYSGTITIHGNARYEGKETLTIKNFKFVTDEAGHYFIDSNSTGSVERYAHNVTVKNSSFAATGDAVDSAVAMRIRQGFDIAVEDVETKNLHSLLQAYGNNGVTINDVIVNGKNGISVGTSTGVVITKADITATGYGIRADGTAASDMTVKNANINAEMSIVVRKNTAADYKLSLEGNKLTAGNDNGYQVIFTKGDDGTYETPEVAFTISGHEGLKVFPMTLTAADIKLDGVLTYNGTEQTQNFVAVNDATFTVTGNTGKDAGTYTATITGTGNYIGSAQVDWTIAKKAATITAKDMTIVAGNEIPAIEVVQDGLAIGDTLAFDIETVEGANQTPGTYEIKVIVDPAKNSNYDVTVVNGTLTVQKAVAKVGTTNYATLKAAIAAANAGDTITFLADITEDVTVNKDLTIDGAKDEENNYTYTGEIKMDAEKTVTVKNVNFVKGWIETTKSVKNKLTVENCDFDGVDNTINYAVTMRSGSSVTIVDCTAKHYLLDMLWVPTAVANVTVQDTQVTECRAAVNVAYGTNITLDNVTTSAVEYGIQTHNYGAKTITIRNCDLEGDHSVFVRDRETTRTTDTFIFEGKNIIRTLPTEYAKLVLNPVKDGKVDDAILITPENVNVNITTTTDGYKVVYDTAAYKLVEKDYVAQIGEGETAQKFESLQEAVNEAENGDVITVTADHELTWDAKTVIDESLASMVVVAGKTVTIDLNGKKLTVDGSKMNGTDLYAVFAADDKGHLTLKDSVGTGSVEAKGISFKGTVTAYCLMMAYEDETSLTVDGGTYYMEAAHDSLIYSGGNRIVTINGGNFTLGNVGNGQNGKPWIFNGLHQNANAVIVNGGTFNADISHQFWANEVYVPEKLGLKKNEDGTWTLVEAVAYVEEIGTSTNSSVRKVGYATLAEAIANADGAEVTLLKDVNENLDIGGQVVINLNKYTNEGTFTLKNVDATLTAGEGLKVVTDVANHEVKFENGVYTVVEIAVAQIGNVTYKTIQEAIEAVEDGGVIQLLSDAGLGLADKALTIMRNGYSAKIAALNGYTVVTDNNAYIVKSMDAAIEDATGAKLAYIDVNKAGHDGEELMSLTTALSKAKSGDVVKLTADLTGETAVGTVTIPSDVTLDIESHTLEAQYIIGLNGSKLTGATVSSSGIRGKVIVPETNIALSRDAVLRESDGASFLPVKMAENTYGFAPLLANVDFTGHKFTVTDESIVFKFRHSSGGTMNGLLAKNGPAYHDLSVKVTLSWKTYDEKGNYLADAYQTFVYTEDMVMQVAGAKDLDYKLTIKNYGELNVDLSSLEAVAEIVSDTGVSAYAEVVYEQ